MNFLTLKPEAFGLDVSDVSLKIVKLKKRGKFLDLASFGETMIKPGIIEKAEIQNEKALVETIKTALTEVKGEKLKTRYAVVSLVEEKAFLEVIPLPIMAEEEVEKAVYFEAENYIPMPVKDVYLDSQIVPPIDNKRVKSDHLDVLIAAFPKKIIDPYLFSIKKAGLKPLALEIESQSITRALVKKEFSSESLLLVDLKKNRTSFIIFFGHSLRFTTTIPLSGQQFTEAISKKLKVDLKKAEELKIKHGIKGDVISNKIFEVLSPSLNDLVKQIQKYLHYYQSHAGKKIEKILLCGGGANLRGLNNFLSTELDFSIEIGNPWINILPKPLKGVPGLSYQESLRYTTALGLALRGIKI